MILAFLLISCSSQYSKKSYHNHRADIKKYDKNDIFDEIYNIFEESPSPNNQVNELNLTSQMITTPLLELNLVYENFGKLENIGLSRNLTSSEQIQLQNLIEVIQENENKIEKMASHLKSTYQELSLRQLSNATLSEDILSEYYLEFNQFLDFIYPLLTHLNLLNQSNLLSPSLIQKKINIEKSVLVVEKWQKIEEEIDLEHYNNAKIIILSLKNKKLSVTEKSKLIAARHDIANLMRMKANQAEKDIVRLSSIINLSNQQRNMLQQAYDTINYYSKWNQKQQAKENNQYDISIQKVQLLTGKNNITSYDCEQLHSAVENITDVIFFRITNEWEKLIILDKHQPPEDNVQQKKQILHLINSEKMKLSSLKAHLNITLETLKGKINSDILTPNQILSIQNIYDQIEGICLEVLTKEYFVFSHLKTYDDGEQMEILKYSINEKKKHMMEREQEEEKKLKALHDRINSISNVKKKLTEKGKRELLNMTIELSHLFKNRAIREENKIKTFLQLPFEKGFIDSTHHEELGILQKSVNDSLEFIENILIKKEKKIEYLQTKLMSANQSELNKLSLKMNFTNLAIVSLAGDMKSIIEERIKVEGESDGIIEKLLLADAKTQKDIDQRQKNIENIPDMVEDIKQQHKEKQKIIDKQIRNIRDKKSEDDIKIKQELSQVKKHIGEKSQERKQSLKDLQKQMKEIEMKKQTHEDKLRKDESQQQEIVKETEEMDEKMEKMFSDLRSLKKLVEQIERKHSKKYDSILLYLKTLVAFNLLTKNPNHV